MTRARSSLAASGKAEPPPSRVKNYITPQGHARLKHEMTHLLNIERPELVKVISWAASNGDRSENGDYIYGKKRLREIDRRIHFLGKRLETAVVVDPAAQGESDRIYFGATVTWADSTAKKHTVTIVGTDEVDTGRGHVSWISPIARALLGKCEADRVILRTPAGEQEIEIISVKYQTPG